MMILPEMRKGNRLEKQLNLLSGKGKKTMAKSKKNTQSVAHETSVEYVAGAKGCRKGKRNKATVAQGKNDKRMEAGCKQNIQAEKFQEERKGNVIPLVAQNDNQRQALQDFKTKQLCILSGSAGSGKSELVVWWACKQWLEGNIDNLIFTRPDKGLGETFPCPGNDTLKLLTFLYPLLLKTKKYLGAGILKNNLIMEDMDILFNPQSGIQIINLAKMGGMSFNGSTIVIADEMQSATVAQIKALTTRAEEGCQVLITGDTTQSPLKREKNGLEYLEDKLLQYPHDLVSVVKFTPDDCCRHGISAHLTRVFEEDGAW